MIRQDRSLRRMLSSAGAALAFLVPASALAQSAHFLSAAVGQSTATTSETTFDSNVSFVDVSYQNGVPGTDPNARALFASVDSASGVLLTSGLTDALLVPNRGRAVSVLEQRMFFGSGGTTPVVVDAILVPMGFASGGFIELDASLQVGSCIAGVRRYEAGGNPPSASTSGCNNTAAVSWNATSSAGLLRITATYTNTPSAVNLRAVVSGDLGGSASDIPDGQFTSAGALSVTTQGTTASYASASFLPEPECVLGPGLLGLVLFGRRRGRS